MWEIYAYQNADSLFGIFNAAAAIHASSDYRAALAAVVFCGFFAALVAYAFAPEKLQGWIWLGSVALVFSLMIMPKVTVGIVDKTGGAPVKVVANVPLGIAALGSLTSTVGHTLTGLFETAFQVIPGAGALPSELSYQKNGLLFGHRLVRETRNVVFQDPAFRTDLINFLYHCSSYDLMDGSLDPGQLSRNENVWELLGNPNPARFSTLTTTGTVDIATCPQVYANLDQRLPAELRRIEGRLAFSLNPTLPDTVAAGVIANEIQQAYLKNSIADASATAASILRQNAVLNALDDSTRITGQKTNDPATMVLAVGRAQAIAQQNAARINAGKVAEQTLPMLRNVIEALMYALFPILVLLLMLTGGRETLMALKGYISVLIWIHLWPPLYAVLNYMATIYSRTLSGEAIVGYLVLSIPFIAWAAVKRMDHLGMALVGGLSELQVDAAYGEAVTANRERAAVLTEAFSRGLATLKSGTQSSASSSTSLEGQRRNTGPVGSDFSGRFEGYKPGSSTGGKYCFRCRRKHCNKARKTSISRSGIFRQVVSIHPVRPRGKGAFQHEPGAGRPLQTICRSGVQQHGLQPCRNEQCQ